MANLPIGAIRVLRAQRGQIHRQQLIALGISRHTIGRLLADEQLAPVARGVYRHPLGDDGPLAVVMTAQLARSAVASHRLAAHLHGLEPWDRLPTPEVTVPRGRHRPVDGLIVHESTQWDRIDQVEIDGLLVTGLNRTLLDVAAVASPSKLMATIDAARRRDLTSWAQLDRTTKRHARRGRNGVQLFRRAVERSIGEDLPALSAWSRSAAAFLVRGGVPEPKLEFRVVDDSGRLLGIVDLAWPQQRLAVELDSVRWHHDRESFTADRRRRNRLEVAGWRVLNVSWSMWRNEPDELLRSVRSSLFLRR